MNTTMVRTPKYILLDGKDRIEPKLVEGSQYTALYGFSNKKLYDEFCAHSQLALKPYPIVKGFLRNQLASKCDHIHLVIVDATGPDAARTLAASMDVVLDSLDRQASQMTASHQLNRDESSQAYRIKENSPSDHRFNQPIPV